MEIDVSNKPKIVARVGSMDLVDAKTGELLKHNLFASGQERRDISSFVKVFPMGFEAFVSVSRSAQLVLVYLISEMTYTSETVLLDYANCMAFCSYKTKTSIVTAIQELLDFRVIAKASAVNTYYINPEMFYKGDRMKLVK